MLLERELISLPQVPPAPSPLNQHGEPSLRLPLLVFSAPSFSIPGMDWPAARCGLLLSSCPTYLFETRLAEKWKYWVIQIEKSLEGMTGHIQREAARTWHNPGVQGSAEVTWDTYLP